MSQNRVIGLITGFYLIFLSSTCQAQEYKLTVYPDQVIATNYIGHGAQWAAYPHCDTKNEAKGFTFGPISEKDYQLTIERMEAMGLNFMRIVIHPGWRYFNGLDPNGNPIVDFENEEQKWLYKILDFCQKNEVTVLFGEWAPRSHKEDGKSGGEWVHIWDDYNPTWAKMIADHLDYLINTKGYTCIKYYDMENEAYLGYSYSGKNFDKYLKGMTLLHEELTKRGLRDKIKLDCSWGNFNNKRDISPENVKRIASVADIYDEHHYIKKLPSDSTDYEVDVRKQIKKLAANDDDFDGYFLGECNFKVRGLEGVIPNTGFDHTKTVFQWENGIYMANKAIQSMRAGILGIIAWDVDDAMHTWQDGGTDLKRWGFWDSMGEELSDEPELEKVRPWAYAWTLMCKYFPTGTQVVKVDGNFPKGVYAVAGLKDGKYSIAIVNQSNDFKKMKLSIDGITNLDDLDKYIYFKGDMPKTKLGFPEPKEKLKKVDFGSGLNIVFPESGLIVLTQL